MKTEEIVNAIQAKIDSLRRDAQKLDNLLADDPSEGERKEIYNRIKNNITAQRELSEVIRLLMANPIETTIENGML